MTNDDPQATSAEPPEDDFVAQLLASLRDTAPMPAEVAARLDQALAQERLESDRRTDDQSMDELTRRREARDLGRGRRWLVGIGAAAALLVAIPVGVALLNQGATTVVGTTASEPKSEVARSADASYVGAPVTASGTAYSAQSLSTQVAALMARRVVSDLMEGTSGTGEPPMTMNQTGPVPQSAQTTSAGSTPPSATATGMAPAEAGGTFAADATRLTQCLESLTRGTNWSGSTPQAIDVGRYAGSPAVVVVYAEPAGSPRWHVWVVNASCASPGRVLFSGAI